MPAVTYSIINFEITGNLLDGAYQAGTKALIAYQACDLLDDGKEIAVLEITFDKGSVTETRDVTNEIIELAAAGRLADIHTTDERDEEDFPDWVRQSDAFGDVPEGPYQARLSAADRWHDERMGA